MRLLPEKSVGGGVRDILPIPLPLPVTERFLEPVFEDGSGEGVLMGVRGLRSSVPSLSIGEWLGLGLQGDEGSSSSSFVVFVVVGMEGGGH